MSSALRFPAETVQAFDRAKILGVRAGTEHRYTGVWPVVVDGRVFVRSWNDAPGGWYRAFLAEPRGSVQLEKRELAVRVRPVRSQRVREAVSRAFAEKYPTPASRKWVLGFAEPERERNTLELLPEG